MNVGNLIWSLIPIGMGLAVLSPFIISIPSYQLVKTAQVKVINHELKLGSTVCVYQIEGHRDYTYNCLYSVGENMTVYKYQDGQWSGYKR